jgi:hypothetical protein
MIYEEILKEFFIQNVSVNTEIGYTTIHTSYTPHMASLNITAPQAGLEKIFEAMAEYCNTNEERELRHQHQSLRDAWEKYQMMLKLVR